MTIQRQYNLPNCTLILEGISNATIETAQVARQSLDVLMRFECHFTNPKQSFMGGQNLLDDLVKATNRCVQEWMSGIRHIESQRSHPGKDGVHLEPSTTGGFQLSVPSSLLLTPVATPPQTTDATTTTDTQNQLENSVDLHLSTVQLFDLVEALDQLLADTQTLPNLSLQLRPLSHREAVSGQPFTKRAAPVALGTTSLALAAAALFFLPVPEVRKPTSEDLTPPKPTTTETQPSSNGSPDPQPTPDSAN